MSLLPDSVLNDSHCRIHHFTLIPKTNLKVFEPDNLSDLRTIETELPILPPSIDFAWLLCHIITHIAFTGTVLSPIPIGQRHL